MSAHAVAKSAVLGGLALIAAGCAIASCAIDAAGTVDDLPGPDDGDIESGMETGGDSEVGGETCSPKLGTACASSGGCNAGTIRCDGSCNAAADPANVDTPCTTGAGCKGTIVCSGECKDLPSGETCDPTSHGCIGKKSCTGACVDVDPKIGTNCYAPPYFCPATWGCDLKCPAPAKVGTACTTVKGCPSLLWCDEVTCPDQPLAKETCNSATCKLTETRDCNGVCPDPLVTPTKCLTCYEGTVRKDVMTNTCGVCAPSCASLGYTDMPDSGTDTGTDTGSDTGTDTGKDTGADTGVSKDAGGDGGAWDSVADVSLDVSG